MDDIERIDDPEEMIQLAAETLLTQLFTSLPGYIVDFDPATCRATVQIGIQSLRPDQDGNEQPMNYPLIQNVPVIFPAGGGCTLTFPVKPGDECWVMFAARDIDAWKVLGGIQPLTTPRKHGLADAVCQVGTLSQAQKISGLSASTTQLRSHDGSTLVELDPQSQAVRIKAPGGFTVDAPQVHFTGQVTADGDITASGISLKSHTHGGVQPGGGKTGQPE